MIIEDYIYLVHFGEDLPIIKRELIFLHEAFAGVCYLYVLSIPLECPLLSLIHKKHWNKIFVDKSRTPKMWE